jgi:hypothetical protein
MTAAAANKQVVRQLFECISAGDFDTVGVLLDDGATWRTQFRTEALGSLADVMSKKVFVEAMKGLIAVMPKGLSLAPHGMTAEDDRVAVEAVSYGVTSKGKVYNNLYHFLFELRDGKVTAVREYCDSLHVQEVMMEVLQP